MLYIYQQNKTKQNKIGLKFQTYLFLARELNLLNIGVSL